MSRFIRFRNLTHFIKFIKLKKVAEIEK